MGGFEDYALAGGPVIGPTGALWWARHLPSGRAVAVTELASAVAADKAFMARLRLATTTLWAVSHPNVLAIHEVVEEPGRVWVIEDWVDGRELGEVLLDGPLTPEQALVVALGVLRGLAAVQGRGVVHGDVSPSSVVVTAGGVVQLVGFGFDGLSGRPPDDRGADALAVAILLGQMLADSPPPSRHRKLDEALTRATSDKARQRPADAAALLAILEKAARSDFGKRWEKSASLAALVVTPSSPKTRPAGDEPAPASNEGTRELSLDATQLAQLAPGEPEVVGDNQFDTGTETVDSADDEAEIADPVVAGTDNGPGEPEGDEVEIADPIDVAGAIVERADADEAIGAPTEEVEQADRPGLGASGPDGTAGAAGETSVGTDDRSPASTPGEMAVGVEEMVGPASATGGRPSDPAPGARSSSKKRKSERSRASSNRKRHAPAPTAPAAVVDQSTPTLTPTGAATVQLATTPPAGTNPPDSSARSRKKDRRPAPSGPVPAEAPDTRTKGRQTPGRGAVRSLAGLILILLGLGAAVAVERNRKDDPSPAASPVPANPDVPTSPDVPTTFIPAPVGPTLDEIATSDIVGTYAMKLVVTQSTGFFGTQVGIGVDKIYTIRCDSTTTPCTLKLAVSGTPDEYTLRRDGTDYVLSEAGPQDCIDLATGAVRVPNGGVASVNVRLRPVLAARIPNGGWVATSLSGTVATTYDTSNPACTQGSGVQQSTAVGNRQ